MFRRIDEKLEKILKKLKMLLKEYILKNIDLVTIRKKWPHQAFKYKK